MALEEARKRGLLTVALLGYDGGEILRRGLADFRWWFARDYIPRIQEVQASIYHVMRELLETAGPCQRLNFSARRVAPTRGKCANGWNGRIGISWSTTWKPMPGALPRMLAATDRPTHGSGFDRRRQSHADRLAGPGCVIRRSDARTFHRMSILECCRRSRAARKSRKWRPSI